MQEHRSLDRWRQDASQLRRVFWLVPDFYAYAIVVSHKTSEYRLYTSSSCSFTSRGRAEVLGKRCKFGIFEKLGLGVFLPPVFFFPFLEKDRIRVEGSWRNRCT